MKIVNIFPFYRISILSGMDCRSMREGGSAPILLHYKHRLLIYRGSKTVRTLSLRQDERHPEQGRLTKRTTPWPNQHWIQGASSTPRPCQNLAWCFSSNTVCCIQEPRPYQNLAWCFCSNTVCCIWCQCCRPEKQLGSWI